MRQSLAQRRAHPRSSAGWWRSPLFFPIFWMVLTSFKTERDAASPEPVLLADARELHRGAGARRTTSFRAEQRGDLGWRHPARAVLRDPGRLRDGLPSDRAHPRHAAMDAVHQDAAAGRRAGADLPDVPYAQFARHAHRPGHDLRADEPADRRLDAVHLLQGSAERNPGGGPHGRRAHLGRGLVPAAAARPCPASRRPACCR